VNASVLERESFPVLDIMVPPPAVRSSTMEGTVDTKRISKHEQKATETRELLLNAAQTVFARDGYEKADLSTIAELAGRTKGAIYGQFASKEEVFLALVEENALRRRAVMHDALRNSHSVEQNLVILREFLLSQVDDQQWSLLMFEFKLFTIRHPESAARLRALQKKLSPGDKEEVYTLLLGDAPKGAVSRTIAVHSLFAILSALHCEMLFSPDLLTRGDVEKVLAKTFDALFEPKPPA